MYRDAANWKQHGTVILDGKLSTEQINEIISALNEGEFFIPSQVGLTDLQDEFYANDKGDLENAHCWNTIESAECFELTNEEPTIERTAEEIYNNFMIVKKYGKWNEFDAEERYS